MNLLTEIIKFFIYSFAIVIIAKYLLVPVLRKLSILLKLGPKAAGNIAGIATSVPELLTVSFSAKAGFLDTGIYNVISSNTINIVQYLAAIYLNKNQKYINNKAIKIDLFLAIVTIIIPIAIMRLNIQLGMSIVIILVLLLCLFYYINVNAHKMYLKEEDKEVTEEKQEEYDKYKTKNNKVFKSFFYILSLIFISISLFIIGNLLSDTLTNLSDKFNLPEILLGIALGIITSIPELITFIEAQKKGKEGKNKNDIQLGVIEATNNLLTSNVLNLFAIQSIGIIIYNIFK